jgi:hypothetical protein
VLSHELLLLGAGAALAGLVQGISGFAFAMVARSHCLGCPSSVTSRSWRLSALSLGGALLNRLASARSGRVLCIIALRHRVVELDELVRKPRLIARPVPQAREPGGSDRFRRAGEALSEAACAPSRAGACRGPEGDPGIGSTVTM